MAGLLLKGQPLGVPGKCVQDASGEVCQVGGGRLGHWRGLLPAAHQCPLLVCPLERQGAIYKTHCFALKNFL